MSLKDQMENEFPQFEWGSREDGRLYCLMPTNQASAQCSYHVEFQESSRDGLKWCAVIGSRFRLYSNDISELVGDCQDKIDSFHLDNVSQRAKARTKGTYTKNVRSYGR